MATVARLLVLKDRLESDDDAVLKKTLRELERVGMTVDMLKETGIGIAVNKLRHHDAFGSMAKQLVSKWKQCAVNDGDTTESNGYDRDESVSKSSKSSYERSSSSSVSKSGKKSNNRYDNSEPSRNKKRPRDDDEPQETFTAEAGSFEQILGMNDSAKRQYSSPVKIQPTISVKKKREERVDTSVNGVESKSSKSKANTSMTNSGYRDAHNSSSSSSSTNVDWSKVLPTKLATEYRPQSNRSMALIDFDEDDARGRGRGGSGKREEDVDFSELKARKMTKVYSGKRNVFLPSVPTLFESCIRVLCDNIDALGYTGGVPFEILKPVLERATAQQLYRVEECNPYLLERTGDLWQEHCKRDFKGVEPDWEEGETWRELHERMLEERDRRLNKLKETIAEKKAEKESAVRQAKMAMAKAPREVRRRQMRYGTFKKEPQLPNTEEIVQSKRNLDLHSGAKASTRVFSHIYEDEQRQKEQPKNRKEKVAPLMAKSLKMMKRSRPRN